MSDSSTHPNPANGNKVSSLSYLELVFKVEDLEREQACSRGEISDLKTLCNTLRTEVEGLKKGGWNVTVGPFREQSSSRFMEELDALKGRVNGNNANEIHKSNRSVPPHLRSQRTPSTSSVPPHLRSKNAAANASVAPHLDGGASNGLVFRDIDWSSSDGDSTSRKDSVSVGKGSADPLVTDGPIDILGTSFRKMQVLAIKKEEPTPPISPKSMPSEGSHVEPLSLSNNTSALKNFKPKYIAELPDLPSAKLAQIPASKDTVTFSLDFILNHLGGIEWSPGMYFVPPPQPCLLPNRTYYLVDAQHDPHLPAAPGQHGAKLVPFFNCNPEDDEEYVDLLPESFDSSSNVPLFVLRSVPGPDGKPRKRLVYYGHYSQTRWSDKLDYDHMAQCVGPDVREYWAERLSESGRAAWVTAALQNHFFPAPPYDGVLPGISIDAGGSVAEEDLEKRHARVIKDVTKHAEKLQAWKREMDMRTALIKKDYILTAFDQADADENKALRLWWEYLECVDWRKDFYDTLVVLQSRNAHYT